MSNDLKASVIIPTHNRKPILLKTLSCYAAQTVSAEKFEIVVVNDGGRDETSSIFKGFVPFEQDETDAFPDDEGGRIEARLQGTLGAVLPDVPGTKGGSPSVKYIEISKSGRSHARNVGIHFSSYPLIIFVDDDIFVEPGFVQKHLESHHHEDGLVVRGMVVHTRHLDDPFSARWKPKDINTSFLATGNASVLKEYVVQAGCFDENYKVYGWEDFDLGIHLEQEGLKSVKNKICGYHYDPKPGVISPDDIYKKEKERGFTAVYLYKTHPLKWVKRFTLVENAPLKALFGLLGRNNWFLRKRKISVFKGILRLIIRYKGYFEGVEQAKRQYRSDSPERKEG